MLDQTQWFTWDRLPERWPFPDLKRQKANDKRVLKLQLDYVACGLGDRAIIHRFLVLLLGNSLADDVLRFVLRWEPALEPTDAAIAIARHLASIACLPRDPIITKLVLLRDVLPWWPDDPVEITSIAEAAVREADL